MRPNAWRCRPARKPLILTPPTIPAATPLTPAMPIPAQASPTADGILPADAIASSTTKESAIIITRAILPMAPITRRKTVRPAIAAAVMAVILPTAITVHILTVPTATITRNAIGQPSILKVQPTPACPGAIATIRLTRITILPNARV